MKKVNCPFCGHLVELNIAKAADADGEEFVCDNCGNIFRYARND